LTDLNSQVVIQTFTLLAMNLVELGVPFINDYRKRKKLQDENITLNEWSFELLNTDKDEMESVIPDYLEIILQMSMILTFGAAFPLSFFIAWLSN